MAEPFEILADAHGQLILRRPGQEDVVDVRAREAFPWTRDGGMVSLRSSAGRELVLIERPADLPIDQRHRLANWMAANTFHPTIRRIDSVNTDFGYQLWTVDTDRGPAEFRVAEKEDIRFLADNRFSIKDVDGNVYILPSLETLDAKSRVAVQIVL